MKVVVNQLGQVITYNIRLVKNRSQQDIINNIVENAKWIQHSLTSSGETG